MNPVIECSEGTLKLYESCLSMPGKQYVVIRSQWVKIRGFTSYGYSKKWKARGNIFAQLLQHEMDHLNGVLIDSIGSLVTE